MSLAGGIEEKKEFRNSHNLNKIMEILEEGKLPGEKEHIGRCSNCGCRLKFKQHEAQFRSFPKNESAWVIKCPTRGCGREIYVDA
jgi:hypothetical protein